MWRVRVSLEAQQWEPQGQLGGSLGTATVARAMGLPRGEGKMQCCRAV